MIEIEQSLVFDRKFWFKMVIWIAVFAFSLRIFMAGMYSFTMDTGWYATWAAGLNRGLFSAYKLQWAQSLDYPPVYLIPLYFIGKIFTAFPITYSYGVYQLILIKLFPILADVATGIFIYYIFRNKNFNLAIAGMVAWMLNPSMFLNSSMWGQTDSLLCILMIVSFYFITNKKPLLGTFIYSIAIMTKFQCIYFLPILVLWLLIEYDLFTCIKAGGLAIATVFVVFLPFSIGAGNPFLIYKVYINGANAYQWYSLHAANFYGLLGLNWMNGLKPDTTPIFLGMSGHDISNVLMILFVLLTLFLMLLARRRNIWCTSFLLIQCIFMFTTRMHERYQIVALPFAFMMWLTTSNKSFMRIFCGISLITFANQALCMAYDQFGKGSPWFSSYETIFEILSFINVIFFIISTCFVLSYMIRSNYKGNVAKENEKHMQAYSEKATI